MFIQSNTFLSQDEIKKASVDYMSSYPYLDSLNDAFVAGANWIINSISNYNITSTFDDSDCYNCNGY